jgi:hypothetical protein
MNNQSATLLILALQCTSFFIAALDHNEFIRVCPRGKRRNHCVGIQSPVRLSRSNLNLAAAPPSKRVQTSALTIQGKG